MIASFFFYSASKKVYLNSTTNLNKLIIRLSVYGNVIGILLTVIGSILAVFYFGTTSGIILSILTLSIFLSLIIVIYPLQVISFRNVLIGLTTMFVLELGYLLL